MLRVYRLLKQLVDAKVPINAVGLQTHWSIYEPTRNELENTIQKFASLGLKIQITELDVSVYAWEKNKRAKGLAKMKLIRQKENKNKWRNIKWYLMCLGNISKPLPIDGMTRAMAVELLPEAIRVNAIAPGFIGTEMSSKALDSDPERKHKALSRTPLGYLGATEDIGAAAAFLASYGAKYITGIILTVDGGNSIGF